MGLYLETNEVTESEKHVALSFVGVGRIHYLSNCIHCIYPQRCVVDDCLCLPFPFCMLRRTRMTPHVDRSIVFAVFVLESSFR